MVISSDDQAYSFPSARLRVLKDPSKTPLVLVICGSFSPVDIMHLRLFEVVADHVKQNMNDSHEVVGGYLSPISDWYNKEGLASATHRIRMCQLACDQLSTWLMVDPWEAIQEEFKPTAIVLDHIKYEINTVFGGISTSSGNKKPASVMLLGGSDMLQTMSQPGIWSVPDLDIILGSYGVFVVERTGGPVRDALAPLKKQSDELGRDWVSNIHVLKKSVTDDISCTVIRKMLRSGMSVHNLLHSSVINYITEHGLFLEEQPLSKEKFKLTELVAAAAAAANRI